MSALAKKMITLLVMMCMLVAYASVASAENAVTLTITGPDGVQEYTSGTYAKEIVISKGGEYTISSSDPAVEGHFSIRVNAPDEEVTLTLDGVNICSEVSSIPSKSAIYCYRAKKVTIQTAAGTENTLEGGSGIWVSGTCGDVILAGEGKLTVHGSVGTDSASSTGGYGNYFTYGPGIYKADSDNNLIIESGTIEAYGSHEAPGIGGNLTVSGGSYGGSSSSTASKPRNIVFKGGNVTAQAFTGDRYSDAQSCVSAIGPSKKEAGCENMIIAPGEGVTITAGLYTNQYYGQLKPFKALWEETLLENTTADISSQRGMVFILTSTVQVKPTATPTAEPTATPTTVPTATPTAEPAITPTVTPTLVPSATPVVTPVQTATPSQTPQTGDASLTVLWYLLAAVSLMGIMAVGNNKKKNA